MPTYEYKCKKCEQHLEVVQSFTDKALTKHKSCGGELRKVFAAPGIAFKGSGFYKTDSRGGSSSSSSSADASSSSSSDSSATSSDASSSSSTTEKKDKKTEKKADKKASTTSS